MVSLRIYIKNKNMRFVIPIPNFFIRFSLKFIQKPFILRNIPLKDRKYIEMIDFDALYRCVDILKEYKGLKVVDVEDKEGTKVIIKI
ncbi:hypothetical protein [Clostridium acetobutylicum]|uniref:hypothetical protein n=2 Tax=Clostridiaceae TaxID=31979 RepID=UPI0030FE818B